MKVERTDFVNISTQNRRHAPYSEGSLP